MGVKFKNMNFKQIDEARKLLELGEEATMDEIKGAYRRLAFKYHPDRCKEKDIKKNAMDEELYEHLKRFYEGWFGDLDL